ncbi:hypothetical protein JCM3765_005241 [Sporobolomyces pararoseus]
MPVKPGNPEWVEWVEQLAADAEDKGKKSSQTFKRAANALKLCPIEMKDPEQARELKGIGDAVVSHIRRKLEEKHKILGLPIPDRASPPKQRRAPTTTQKKRNREEEEAELDAAREARRLRTMGIAQPTAALGFQAHPDGAFKDLPLEQEDLLLQEGKGKGKGKSTTTTKRDYLPKQGSGAYAILISLYLNASYDEHSVSTLKTKIIEDARKFSETSFDKGTANRDGQRREGQGFTYTAWSGMSTLTGKGLVVAESRVPARFHLTESGYQLAERLVEVAGVAKHQFIPSSSGGHHPSSSSSLNLNRQPSSSSGFVNNNPSSHRPPQNLDGGGSSTAAFSGRGQTLGGRTLDIHSNVFRRRTPTPPLFLEEIQDSSPTRTTTTSTTMQVDDNDDEDLIFERDMRKAMEISRKESTSAGGGGREDLVARIARETAMRNNGNQLGGGVGGTSSSSSAFRPAGSTSLSGRKAALGNFASSSRTIEASQVPSIANVDNAFGYFYLDENDRRTKLRSEAEVSQPETGQLYYRIEYRTAQDLHPMVRGLWNPSILNRSIPIPPDKTKSAYIKERVSNEFAPGFPESSFNNHQIVKEKDKRSSFISSSSTSNDSVSNLLAGYKDSGPKKRKDEMYKPPPEVRRLGAIIDLFEPVTHSLPTTTTMAANLKRPNPSTHTHGEPVVVVGGFASSSSSSQPLSFSSRIRASSPPPPPPPLPQTIPLRRTTTATSSNSDRTSTTPLIQTTSSQNPYQASYDPPPGSQIINRHPLDPVRDYLPSSSSSPNTSFPTSFKPIIWTKGTFKIYLIIDTREGTREMGKRIELCEKMSRDYNIKVDSKMLPLGDMLWVARKIDSKTGKPLQGVQDVVLDAIVERKRLDDLISSIMDGRYLGQKIRLKDSGISHRIYLIEKYGETNSNASFGKAIWTCKSQLQVNDGFFVHESANLEDTINYLKKRTQIMCEIYENSDLKIIPDEIIERSNYLSLQNHLRSKEPFERYLINYSIFSELNKPDSNLTLKVQWASMITKINGMSPEKSVQFLKRWETFFKFYKEAKDWEKEVQEENQKLDELEKNQGGTSNKKKVVKRRKVEDFVVSNLEDVGTRGIKGKLGAKIWDLFMTKEERYTS